MTADNYLIAHARAAERDQECFRLEAELAALRERLAEVEREKEAWRKTFEEDGRDARYFGKAMSAQQKAAAATACAEAAESRVKQIRAETIEECAKVADDYRDKSPDPSLRIGAGWIAGDIRRLASKEGGK